MDPIILLVKQLAGAEQKSDEYVLCQIGKRICNVNGKRNLAKIFERLGDETENYKGDFKYSIPVETAIQIKIKCMLSVTDYENLRESNNYMSFERLGTEIPKKVTLWAA